MTKPKAAPSADPKPAGKAPEPAPRADHGFLKMLSRKSKLSPLTLLSTGRTGKVPK